MLSCGPAYPRIPDPVEWVSHPQMGSSDLTIREPFGPHPPAPLQGAGIIVFNRFHCRDMHRSGEHRSRLPHIDVIVWVHLLRSHNATQDLNRPVRDDFVGVHVCGSARASLENIDDELVVELSLNHFLRRFHDCLTDRFLQQPQPHVHLSCSHFNQAQSTDELTRHSQIANRKILDRPLCQSAVQRIRGNANLTHRVALEAAILDFSSGRLHRKNSGLESERLLP